MQTEKGDEKARRTTRVKTQLPIDPCKRSTTKSYGRNVGRELRQTRSGRSGLLHAVHSTILQHTVVSWAEGNCSEYCQDGARLPPFCRLENDEQESSTSPAHRARTQKLRLVHHLGTNVSISFPLREFTTPTQNPPSYKGHKLSSGLFPAHARLQRGYAFDQIPRCHCPNPQ